MTAVLVGTALVYSLACGVGLTEPEDESSPPGSAGATGPLVTNVEPEVYETDTLQTGIPVYVDREYQIDGVPSEYHHWLYVRTSNDDKSSTEDVAVTFELADSATVALAYDERATRIPTWLEEWSATDDRLQTTDVNYAVFTRIFPPGPVTLGGNLSGDAEGAESMYLVSAVSLDGSIEGSDTGGDDPATVPAAPSELSVGATSSSRITGTFTDNAANESGFEVERDDGSGWVLAAELAADDTDFSDTGLSPETTYSYRVRAVNSAGASDYSNVAEATTPAESTSGSGEHPNEPTGFTTIFEADFNAGLPPAGLSSSDSEKCGWTLAGCGFRIEESGDLTIQSESTAPESPDGAFQFLYPEGLLAGSSPGWYQAWDAADPAAYTEYERVYESFHVRGVNNDFEFRGTDGIKMFGYWGVGDRDGVGPHQVYYSVHDPSGTDFPTESKIAVRGQDHLEWKRHQNQGTGNLFTYGEWHQVEALWELDSSPGAADGRVRIWVDGVLILDHGDIPFRDSSNSSGFWGRRWDPVYGFGDLETTRNRDDFLQVDHHYISGDPMN